MLKNLKVKEWIERGNLPKEVDDTDSILCESGELMESSNACEILGGRILFEGTDGKYYTVTVETVIALAHPAWVKEVLAEKKGKT
jgi:hypothetical protein